MKKATLALLSALSFEVRLS